MKRVLPALLLVIGIAVSVLGFRDLAIAEESRSWPSVQGTVTDARLLKRLDRHHLTKYKAAISYAFTLNGTAYEGRNIGFSSEWVGERSAAELQLAEYPEGKTVDVYYDPNGPDRSVLDRRITAATYGALAIGIATALGGGMLSYFAYVRGRLFLT